MFPVVEIESKAEKVLIFSIYYGLFPLLRSPDSIETLKTTGRFFSHKVLQLSSASYHLPHWLWLWPLNQSLELQFLFMAAVDFDVSLSVLVIGIVAVLAKKGRKTAALLNRNVFMPQFHEVFRHPIRHKRLLSSTQGFQDVHGCQHTVGYWGKSKHCLWEIIWSGHENNSKDSIHIQWTEK